MAKIMTYAQFHDNAQRLEQKLTAYVIVDSEGEMVGKLWWERKGADRSGIPRWNLYLWDWTPEASHAIQGVTGVGVGMDMQQALISELSFGGVQFIGWDGRNEYSWQDQLRKRGYKVHALV